VKKIIGFLLIGLAALILILNVGFTDGVTVNLLVAKIHTARSIVLLSSIALGVAIGLLMK
jgi:hypothetical protein